MCDKLNRYKAAIIDIRDGKKYFKDALFETIVFKKLKANIEEEVKYNKANYDNPAEYNNYLKPYADLLNNPEGVSEIKKKKDAMELINSHKAKFKEYMEKAQKDLDIFNEEFFKKFTDDTTMGEIATHIYEDIQTMCVVPPPLAK